MQKTSIILFSIALTINSCGDKCDTTTAAGASQCLCELIDETVAIEVNDTEKMQKATKKSIELNNAIQKSIEAGKYTKEELEKIAKDRGCM